MNELLNYEFSLTPEQIEQVKNKIDEEQDDFEDIGDILNKMSNKHKQLFYDFFYRNSLKLPKNSQFRIKVLCDIDNTLIENSYISPHTSFNTKDGNLIDGVIDVIKFLSPVTTTTFISARPPIIENRSIRTLKIKLADAGIKSYTFKSGSIHSLYVYLFNQKLSFEIMAKLKIQRFKEIEKVYPNSKFYFLGDDSQGDVLFARWLLENNSEAIAIIYKTGLPQKYHIPINPRFIYHSNYYDVLNLLKK